ncbi:phage portal protein [Streptomonospora wellingtoniae]|uniref:Phage portal protein n=1 Tax=Streptomonospora wellingtoniae TaxID=3075544 RepID=A0ABU2L0J3_9ACTN|nr:phage portal protein [Streptomonospora sp. DSM 45055]MDT0305074.1 phage portal protein [Streptomonospora sp. DSM 45055]
MPDVDGVQMDDGTAAALQQLSRLGSELTARQPVIENRLNYLRGHHPLVYASDEFQSYMGDRFHGFADNWCAPVINSPAERMNILGIRPAGETAADKEMQRIWRDNACDRTSSEALTVMLAAARSYALVWNNPRDEQTPRITFERADQCVVRHDPETGEATAGLKLWRDEKYEYATLYTPEALWKWRRAAARVVPEGDRPDPAVQAGGGWEPRQSAKDDTWPVPNPLGALPLVEFRNQTLLDDAPISDIDGVIAMQNAINLVWAYLMNALDYATLPQRVVTGADMPKVPVLNSDGQKVDEKPLDLDQLVKDRILWIPSESASTSEWSAARLDVFSSVIERAIEHVAAQTRTPPHYLIGRIANLSAEALASAETGLVSKTGERIVYANPDVREIHALSYLVLDNDAKARAMRGGTVLWADPQYRALGQKVDAMMKLKQIGFPFAWIAEQYGLEPEEVARVMEMREHESRMDPLAAMVDEMGRSGGAPAEPPTEPAAEPAGEPAAEPGP